MNVLERQAILEPMAWSNTFHVPAPPASHRVLAFQPERYVCLKNLSMNALSSTKADGLIQF